MAGLRGNTAWFMGARQAAAGTPATPGVGTAFKSPFASGAMGPVRTINTLAETDSNRDIGVAYVSTSGVSGSPQMYVRDDVTGLYLLGALGADAITGTTPNFTHTFTPSNSLPYMTCWLDIADTLWEQYLDCMISDINFSTTAGNPLTAAMTVVGRQASRLTTDPSIAGPIPLSAGQVYTYNDATVTLSGGATALVSAFDCTINNNVTPQQTDNVVPYDVVAGMRQVDISFTLIFNNLAEYNSFHYGSTSGTAISNSVYTTSAAFVFSHGTNNSLTFTIPSMAYQTFPVSPDTTGAPISVAVTAVAQRNSSGVLTCVLKNQIAAYTAT